MLALNYTKSIVLALYLDEQGSVNPSASDIQQFDNDLKAAWDTVLNSAMNHLGIAIDQATKSVILQYSVSAAGSSFPEQARAGCQYFLNTRNI